MKCPLLLTAASVALFAAGCAQDERHAQYNSTMSPTYSSGRMSDYNAPKSTFAIEGSSGVNTARVIPPSDSSLVSAVRESLRQNMEIAPMVPSIQINANNGAIVLNGSVQSVEQKRQVGAIARNVAGVVAVNNQLTPLMEPSAPKPLPDNPPANPLLNENPTNDGAGHANTNGLPPDGSDKLYQQNTSPQSGQVQNPNGNPMP